MKKSLVILMTAVLLVLMLPPLGQRVFAAEYTVTWDPNGGTPGQQWKNTEIVTYSETAAPELWWTPNYSEEVCAPPAGMTFDAYDVGGDTFVFERGVAAHLDERPSVLIVDKHELSRKLRRRPESCRGDGNSAEFPDQAGYDHQVPLEAGRNRRDLYAHVRRERRRKGS